MLDCSIDQLKVNTQPVPSNRCSAVAAECITFVLGHALAMKAIHGGKAKNDKIDSSSARSSRAARPAAPAGPRWEMCI